MLKPSDQMQALLALAERRRDRAARAVAASRVTLAEKVRIRDEQQALISALRQRVDQLDARRMAHPRPDVDFLKLAVVHRRLLVNEREKEEFYIGAMQSDVNAAEQELLTRQREWNRQRERVALLDDLCQRHGRDLEVRREIREDVDRTPVVVACGGEA